jgi:hypothetical protein
MYQHKNFNREHLSKIRELLSLRFKMSDPARLKTIEQFLSSHTQEQTAETQRQLVRDALRNGRDAFVLLPSWQVSNLVPGVFRPEEFEMTRFVAFEEPREIYTFWRPADAFAQPPAGEQTVRWILIHLRLKS